MSPDPEYSCVYIVLVTSEQSLEGHGFTFSIGRGNEIMQLAAETLKHKLIGRNLADITNHDTGADGSKYGFATLWRDLCYGSQMKWCGPEKGPVHQVGYERQSRIRLCVVGVCVCVCLVCVQHRDSVVALRLVGHANVVCTNCVHADRLPLASSTPCGTCGPSTKASRCGSSSPTCPTSSLLAVWTSVTCRFVRMDGVLTRLFIHTYIRTSVVGTLGHWAVMVVCLLYTSPSPRDRG